MPDGRISLITGAAGNLGQAVAAAFASAGAALVLLDHSEPALRSAYGADEGRRMPVVANLLDQTSVSAAVERALARFGRIDVLCNIAGGFEMGKPVHQTSDETWQRMLDLNAKSLIHAAHAVVPGMLAARYGKVINIAAAAGIGGKANMGAYSAAKSAVIRLTESMSAELREHGVNVNCILPSIIDTPQNRAAMPDADPRRWVAPAALAEVVLFLASDKSSAIHGAALPVTGLV